MVRAFFIYALIIVTDEHEPEVFPLFSVFRKKIQRLCNIF